MIEHMDRRVGDLMKKIESLPGADNTVIVFLSDNGATRSGSNGSLRGHKSQLFEGGIGVPCLMSWPARIPPGTTTNQVALSMDLTATLAAAANVAPAPGRPFDGINLLDVLTRERAPYEREVFWRFKRGDNRRRAVLQGDLKLILEGETEHLFDLAADPGETRNLAPERRENVTALRAKIATWEQQVMAPRLRDFPKNK